MRKQLYGFFLFLFLSIHSFGQSTNAPLSKEYNHLIDRFEILNGAMVPGLHTSAKPYQRHRVAQLVDSIAGSELSLSSVDQFNLQYLAIDNMEWTSHGDTDSRKPILKYFYKNKADLYHVGIKDFDLHLNPVLYFSGGKEQDSDITNYINTRGLEMRGMIAERLGFYTFLSTTQSVFPEYVRQHIAKTTSVPYEGFWKDFKENGIDYFTARGYISFDVVKKYINVQFGHDKPFKGNGYRSMMLSDFTSNYLFLKLNTNIWKFNYQNIFAQLYADAYANTGGSLEGPYPKKFLSMHHLSFNVTDNLNIGLFESVVHGDSTRQTFDPNYLNPIIFLRALEHQNGSADNAMVGVDFKWNFLRHFSMYGQFMLDEFKLDEITGRTGWWANKHGGQIGMKYIDAFGLKNIDLQAEYNYARPYLYAYKDTYRNYAHYGKPLAHDVGANFTEWVGVLRAQPYSKWTFTAEVIVNSHGEDEDETRNWGKDVMKSYVDREQDYNNETGQGVATRLLIGDFTLTYQFKHNVFFDLNARLRKLDSDISANESSSTYVGANFRWNIAKVRHMF